MFEVRRGIKPGTKLSEFHKRRMREEHVGTTGYKHTLETRQKISKTMKEKKKSY